MITQVSANAWTSVVTTTTDTVFQNRGGSVMYVTTESTSGRDTADGIAVPQLGAVVISANKSVSVSFDTTNGYVYFAVV